MRRLTRWLAAALLVCAALVSAPRAALAEPEASGPTVRYSAHVQYIGWMDEVEGGEPAGSRGQGLRMEAVKISLADVPEDVDLGLACSAHIQNLDWTDGVVDEDGTVQLGTVGRALRVEAMRIWLTGKDAERYDIWYEAHAQNYGDLGWAKNGASSGTAGKAYRLEAITIKLQEKGAPAPGPTSNAFYNGRGGLSGVPDAESGVLYTAHVQNVGWQNPMRDGEMAGTENRALRVESIKIDLGDELKQRYPDSAIEYRSHVQNVGWEKSWRRGGAPSGTTGSGWRIEAVQIRLTGSLGDDYDVWYCLHVQNRGWLDWAKDGAPAGTANYSQRVEGIKMLLVEKGSEAPGKTERPYVVAPGTQTPDGVGSYTVAFKPNADDATGEMEPQDVAREAAVKLAAVAFEREGYAFAGWNSKADGSGTSFADGAEITNAAQLGETLTLYAQWKALEHTVTFVDYDGTLLGEPQTVKHGEAAKAPAEPTHDDMTFAGWDRDFDAVTDDLTVTATYKGYYRVEFEDADGSSLRSSTLKEGTVPVAPELDERAGFVFLGWLPVAEDGSEGELVKAGEDLPKVEANARYRAAFERHYTVTFKYWDAGGADVEKSQDVVEGAAANAPEVADIAPTGDAAGRRFDGWDKDVSAVTDDLVVTAKSVATHTVTFMDTDGTTTIAGPTLVDEGSAPALPADELLDKYAPDHMILDAWVDAAGKPVDLSSVTANLVVRATWKSDDGKHRVTFVYKDEDGSERTYSVRVEHGAEAVSPDVPRTIAGGDLRFEAWDRSITMVTSDFTTQAIYCTTVPHKLTIYVGTYDEVYEGNLRKRETFMGEYEVFRSSYGYDSRYLLEDPSAVDPRAIAYSTEPGGKGTVYQFGEIIDPAENLELYPVYGDDASFTLGLKWNDESAGDRHLVAELMDLTPTLYTGYARHGEIQVPTHGSNWWGDTLSVPQAKYGGNDYDYRDYGFAGWEGADGTFYAAGDTVKVKAGDEFREVYRERDVTITVKVGNEVEDAWQLVGGVGFMYSGLDDYYASFTRGILSGWTIGDTFYPADPADGESVFNGFDSRHHAGIHGVYGGIRSGENVVFRSPISDFTMQTVFEQGPKVTVDTNAADAYQYYGEEKRRIISYPTVWYEGRQCWTRPFTWGEFFRDGYHAVGFKDAQGNCYAFDDIGAVPAGGLTLYVQWKKDDVPVYVYPDGPDGRCVTEHCAANSYYCLMVFDITDFAANSGGERELLGWSLTPDGPIVYPFDTAYEWILVPKEGLSLYAHWRDFEESPELTLHGNGGTLSGGTTSKSGESVKVVTAEWNYESHMHHIAAEEPTRSGYTFAGWNTKADGTGDRCMEVDAGYWGDGRRLYLPASGATDLYAQWELDDMWLALDANGGHFAKNEAFTEEMVPLYLHTDDDGTVRYGLINGGYGLDRLRVPTRDGYTFRGWSTSADAVEPLYALNDAASGWYEPLRLAAAPTRLFAVWAERTFTITFTVDGEIVETRTDIPLGGSIPEADMPVVVVDGTRRLLGWARTGGSGGPDLVMSIEDVRADANYLALFKSVYTVAFVASDGTDVIRGSYDSGTEITAPLGPVIRGKTFDRWVDGGGSSVSAGESFNLYANRSFVASYHDWAMPDPTVTFVARGGIVDGSSQDYRTITAEFDDDADSFSVCAPSASYDSGDGFVLRGWSEHVDGSGPLVRAGERVEVAYGQMKTLHAVFAKPDAQLVLHRNSVGSTFERTIELFVGDPVTIQGVEDWLAHDDGANYAVTGTTWNTRSDGKGTTYRAGDVITIEAGGNDPATLHLYAQNLATPRVTIEPNAYPYEALVIDPKAGLGKTSPVEYGFDEDGNGRWYVDCSQAQACLALIDGTTMGMETGVLQHMRAWGYYGLSLNGWASSATDDVIYSPLGNRRVPISEDGTSTLTAQWEDNNALLTIYMDDEDNTSYNFRAVCGGYLDLGSPDVDMLKVLEPDIEYLNTKHDGSGTSYSVHEIIPITTGSMISLYPRRKTGDEEPEVPTHGWVTLHPNLDSAAWNDRGGNEERLCMTASFDEGATYARYSFFSYDDPVLLSEQYRMTGWNTKADGTGASYSAGLGDAVFTSADVDLYAQWERI